MLETRKNEVRFATADPKEMIGKFIAKKLVRSWTEEFVDKATSEIVPIERAEVIAERGRIIDQDLCSSIQFFIGTGDIKTVEVSNQRRGAEFRELSDTYPWQVTISNVSSGKKMKFVLYASTLEMAIEIVKDYVELTYRQMFTVSQVKQFDSCIILKDSLSDNTAEIEAELTTKEEEQKVDKKFYQIETSVIVDDVTSFTTFVIETKDIDRAMLIINDFVKTKFTDKEVDSSEFEVKLEGAKVIPCDCYIDREFSMAYIKE